MKKIIIYVPLIGAIFLLLSGLKHKKERKTKNINILKILEKWSLKLKINSGKDEEKLKVLVMKAGLDIKPETIRFIQYVTPIIVFFIIIAIKYTNILNSILNVDQLREVAKYLNDDSFGRIDTSIDYAETFLTSIIFYCFPIFYLKVLGYIRDIKSKDEVLMLQTYALMMLKTNQSVQQILIVLFERSKIFKIYLEKAVNGYSQNPELSLKELKRVEDKGFEKIIVALEQALNKNREMSLKYLEKHRVLTKELNRIERKAKDSQKKVVGILMLIVPLGMFAIIGGYPWFMLSLKAMNDINF